MLELRRMTNEDVSAVAAIERECFSMPWSKQGFLDSLAQEAAHFLVAEEEGRILGYVGLYISFDEGEITNVAVTPIARGRHVASAILEELHRQAKEKGVGRIVLEVRQSNEPAIGLYHRMGYQEIGIRKGFYDAPKEDAILMEVYI